MFKKLLKVTATKRSIIISLCFGILAILVLSYFFKLAFELYLNPTYNLGYIYPYGYGLYAKDFSIILGIIIVTYIIVLFFLVRKHVYNVIFTIFLFLIFLSISVVGLFIVSFKERSSFVSYTTDINNYQVYDELVAEQIGIIFEQLPDKTLVKRYEYLLQERRVWLSKYHDFIMYVETDYDQNVHYKILNDENTIKEEDLDDSLLNGFEIYQYKIDKSFYSKDPIVNFLFIFVNKSDKRIIYAVSRSRGNVFKRYNNNMYIGAFINGERKNPYFRYKSKS